MRIRKAMKLGPLGGLKTVSNSAIHTRSLSKLVVGSNVITRISRSANVDIAGRAIVGIRETDNVGHSKAAKTLLKLTAGSTFRARSGTAGIGPCSSVVIDDGEFVIGESYINSRATILCRESITIGDNCAISWDVTLVDDDLHEYEIGGEQQPSSAPIRIGNNVWVGHGVSIKKGVCIGDDAIVASDSVVTEDVPPSTLVAGVPAQPVRRDVRKT